jgi:hypothetical protein
VRNDEQRVKSDEAVCLVVHVIICTDGCRMPGEC